MSSAAPPALWESCGTLGGADRENEEVVGRFGCGTFVGLCDAQWCFVVTTATDAPRRGLRKYQRKQSTKISLDKT